MQKSSEQRRAEQAREKEGEREGEGDSAWAVGGGFLAENRTLVIFSFRQFLCLAGTPLSAAIQVAVKMKEKYLCWCLIDCSLAPWMPEMICMILF